MTVPFRTREEAEACVYKRRCKQCRSYYDHMLGTLVFDAKTAAALAKIPSRYKFVKYHLHAHTRSAAKYTLFGDFVVQADNGRWYIKHRKILVWENKR